MPAFEGVAVISNEGAHEVVVVGDLGKKDIEDILPMVLYLTHDDLIRVTFNTEAAYQLRLEDETDRYIHRSIILLVGTSIFVEDHLLSSFPDPEETRWARHWRSKLRPDLDHVYKGETIRLFLPMDTFSGSHRRELSVELPVDPASEGLIPSKLVARHLYQFEEGLHHVRFWI